MISSSVPVSSSPALRPDPGVAVEANTQRYGLFRCPDRHRRGRCPRAGPRQGRRCHRQPAVVRRRGGPSRCFLAVDLAIGPRPCRARVASAVCAQTIEGTKAVDARAVGKHPIRTVSFWLLR